MLLQVEFDVLLDQPIILVMIAARFGQALKERIVGCGFLFCIEAKRQRGNLVGVCWAWSSRLTIMAGLEDQSTCVGR